MAANLGFEVVLIHDATATFERCLPDGTRYDAELVHRVALASLHREFAILQSAEETLEAVHASSAVFPA
jgi:nicotinamidase-related amidase